MSDLRGLAGIVERADKCGLAFVDANLVLHGLFPEKQFSRGIEHRFHQAQLDSAETVIGNLGVGRNDSTYVPAFFGPNYSEIKTQIHMFSYKDRGGFYSWLSAATLGQTLMFLEADSFVTLPDDVRECFEKYRKGESKSNKLDKALLATAILIAEQTGLEVLVASHDQDVTNSILKQMLERYQVLTCGAEEFHKRLTRGPALVARTALTPAAIRTMPGCAPASPQPPLGSSQSPPRLALPVRLPLSAHSDMNKDGSGSKSEK